MEKIYFFLIRILLSKQKKLARTSFCCLDQEVWLDDSWKLIYINQSRFNNFFHVRKFKNFNVTLKYFAIFNNRPPASWVAHLARDFVKYYSCSCYSSMILIILTMMVMILMKMILQLLFLLDLWLDLMNIHNANDVKKI